MIRILCMYCIMFSTALSFAQNAGDVLRYNGFLNHGTARNSAMGNSMQALGGDISAIHSNPAGIAIYRSSEFSLSTSLRIDNTTSTHYGEKNDRSNVSLKLDQIGYIKSAKKNRDYGALFGSFGIGYNRVADFNREYFISGPVTESSFLDPLYDDLIQRNLTPEQISTDPNIRLETLLAWESYLLDVDQDGNYFHSNEFWEGVQSKSVTTSGGINSYYVSYGENYQNKFFWGILGELTSISYREDISYSEELPLEGRITDLQSLNFRQELNTSGTGFKLKAGLIYKPVDQVRFGISYQSPSTFTMNDRWNQYMSSTIDSLGISQIYSEEFRSDYKMRVPGRVNVSAAYILGKKALFSASYEFVDQSSIEYKSSESYTDFSFENEIISSIYTPSHNLNIGTEYRINHFAIRGGYRFMTDPYSNSSNNSSPRHIFSLGGGFRNGSFFADLSYRLQYVKENTWLYDSYYISPSELKQFNHAITASIGFRWK